MDKWLLSDYCDSVSSFLLDKWVLVSLMSGCTLTVLIFISYFIVSIMFVNLDLFQKKSARILSRIIHQIFWM